MIFGVPARARCSILFLNQQPFVALAAFHADDGKFSTQLFAGKAELEIPARKLFFRAGVSQQLIGTAIPQHHAAAAVIALGNHALELAVFERMVFHHHRQALLVGIEGRTLGNRPGLQRAADFQPEIVM